MHCVIAVYSRGIPGNRFPRKVRGGKHSELRSPRTMPFGKENYIERKEEYIMVKQNIVFVENTPGSLQKVTRILAENQIDIYGFGCFDAPEFANFRMVCDDPEKADKIMAENGYMTRITQAILVDLQDEIGGLDKLLSVMGDSNVNLHYIYTFFHRGLKVPVAIMHCEDLLVAESVLRNNGFKVLNRLVNPDGAEEEK